MELLTEINPILNIPPYVGFIIGGIIAVVALISIYLDKKKIKTLNTEAKKRNIVDEEELIEKEQEDIKFPYILNKNLLTNKEQKFYGTLLPIAYKYNLIILSKMRIADIISVPKDTYNSIKWFNYIKAKHIDFVLCDSNFSVKLMIEVDDNTHDYDNRKKRDEFVNKIFNQMNIPLLRYRLWTSEELENAIKNIIFPQQIKTAPNTVIEQV